MEERNRTRALQVDKPVPKTRNHDKPTQKVEPFSTALDAAGVKIDLRGATDGARALEALSVLVPMLDRAWLSVSRLEDRIKVLEDDKKALAESLEKLSTEGFGLEGSAGGLLVPEDQRDAFDRETAPWMAAMPLVRQPEPPFLIGEGNDDAETD